MAARDPLSQRSAKRPAEDGPSKEPQLPPIRPRPWWLIFLLVLLINYALTQTFFEPSAVTVPYSFFKQQVEAGNVKEVTGIGDTIRGTFKEQVTYPPPLRRRPKSRRRCVPRRRKRRS